MQKMMRRHLLTFMTLLAAWPAYAQFRVEVSGVGLTQLPIAFAPFRGEDAAPRREAHHDVAQGAPSRGRSRGCSRASAAGSAPARTTAAG